MSIDKEKAGTALEGLAKLIPGPQVIFYANTVEQDLSYAEFCLQTLGPKVGERYLSEQYVEYLEYMVKAAFDKVSVPEVVLAELSGKQDWHKADNFATVEALFSAEAGEPWHPSLREKYKPTPEVTTWFNDRPFSSKLSIRILTTVYK